MSGHQASQTPPTTLRVCSPCARLKNFGKFLHAAAAAAAAPSVALFAAALSRAAAASAICLSFPFRFFGGKVKKKNNWPGLVPDAWGAPALAFLSSRGIVSSENDHKTCNPKWSETVRRPFDCTKNGQVEKPRHVIKSTKSAQPSKSSKTFQQVPKSSNTFKTFQNVEYFKRPKHRDDSSQFDDLRTRSIASTRTFL